MSGLALGTTAEIAFLPASSDTRLVLPLPPSPLHHRGDCLLLLSKKFLVQACNGNIFLFLLAQAVDHQGKLGPLAVNHIRLFQRPPPGTCASDMSSPLPDPPTRTPPPLPRFACFQNPTPPPAPPGPASAHVLMPVIWLQWGEPTHNLCILVGLIELVGVETTYYVAAVGIAVAGFDRLCICILGDGVLLEILDG